MCSIFYAFLILTAFVKLVNLLRIFHNVSFIVKMLRRVAVELLPFIFLFVCFIVVFSMMIMTLGFDLGALEDDPYQGIYQFGYIMYILRTSIGDFEVDTFS